MGQGPTIAAAVITYNEEKRIQDCLNSVAPFVDEIVVLDSLSTDATETICRSHPKVRFFQHPFEGHIQQKNRALDYCNAEWILCIDADERVSPELQQSIESFLNSSSKAVGAQFPRLTYHMHRAIKHGGWYPNARYRLIKKGYAQWGGENPHDCLILNGAGTTLSGDLIHLSFEDLSDQVHTINHFSSIAALARYNKGQKFALWRLWLKPLSKFFELYWFKRGFLDGLQGLIIAISSAYSSFLKEAKLYEMQVLQSEKPSNLSQLYQKEP
ncbi:glycosyltransferase family 2 protein [Deltaproteobacteria bacterium TL4]